MIEGVNRTLDFKDPAWTEDAVISLGAVGTAAPPDGGTGACSGGSGMEAYLARSPVAKTALEAVEMGLLELSTGTNAVEDTELDQAGVYSLYNDSGDSSETILPEAELVSRTERGDSGFSEYSEYSEDYRVLEPEKCLRSPPLDADIFSEMVLDELQNLRLWYASLVEDQKWREDTRTAEASIFVRAAG